VLEACGATLNGVGPTMSDPVHSYERIHSVYEPVHSYEPMRPGTADSLEDPSDRSPRARTERRSKPRFPSEQMAQCADEGGVDEKTLAAMALSQGVECRI
jgi:hypothetical protein